MNTKERGYYRDKRIQEAIEAYRSLSTDQARVLLFNFKYGQRKAQERLLKLHQRGKLQREKLATVYAYYLDSRPGKLRHLIDLNWVRLWFEKKVKQWEKIHSWQYEQDYGFIRPDAFVAVKNTVTGKFKFHFVEMDRGTNSFDKVGKYCKLYETKGYSGRWWVNVTNRFPAVLFVATSKGRMEGIETLIKDDNTAGIEFKVKLLEEVKKEVLRCVM